ncbi:uncharacterized protein [Argopecten irradians]|uniref:uncharacterized protein n=1 Tax=Argopecten irradians TaxID=31199 RepID=UPI0037245B9E
MAGKSENSEEPMEPDAARSRRLITMTEKAAEQFRDRVESYQKRLHTAWCKIQAILDERSERQSPELLKKTHTSVCLEYASYRLVSNDYASFLDSSRCKEGERLFEQHNDEDKHHDHLVNQFLEEIETKRSQIYLDDKKSTSGRSSRSYTSSTSSIRARAKAKAEAARAAIPFTEKKALLLKQQAIIKEQEALSTAQTERKRLEIEAEMQLLHEQRLCAEAEAEVEALETMDKWDIDEQSNRVNDNIIPSDVNSTERVKQYVESQQPQPLQPMASDSQPLTIRQRIFLPWKAGFLNVVKELGVSPIEELDLLVKWLGPESTKHAISIRSSNISNPERGLKKIWERLEERYGSPALIESTLKKKLAALPKITKDYAKLYELHDTLMEVSSAMENEKYASLLSYFNSSTGVTPIVQKLPHHLQGKWTHKATKYMNLHGVAYPPFSVFCAFIKETSSMLNNPSFIYDDSSHVTKNDTNRGTKSSRLKSLKTEIETPKEVQPKDKIKPKCPFHNIEGHTLNACRTFKSKPLNVRKKFIKDKGLCFKCCERTDHIAKTCQSSTKCNACDSDSHPSALHVHGGEGQWKTETSTTQGDKGGDVVKSACSKVCGESHSPGKSCAKVVLVQVHPKDFPKKTFHMYALIDDQSNRSLAKPEFFYMFHDRNYAEVQYSLSSCAGVTECSGRKTERSGFIIKDLEGLASIELPSLTECREIPDVREEIPTPNVARSHAHLQDIASKIPELDNKAQILLLIGRDLPEAHHVLEQRTGSRGSPYAQRLQLGWVIVGETCLGQVHKSDVFNVKKTFVLKDGRHSMFPPCENQFELKENRGCDDVFKTTKHDNKVGLSVDDKLFMDIMDRDVTKDHNGNWVAPLPFHATRPKLPNNRNMALRRAQNLSVGLRKNPTKRQHFTTFMKRMFDSNHAELAPPMTSDEESWYLPIFGVYHPKKKDQIRVVFDSSARFNGLSLNDVLMSGPDLTNSLLGVLMRFRREPIGITADIQQMFYEFRVEEKHRNFLRFFWFKDNNPDLELIEYRMCVHVFGNSPSPAIATYGLRKSAEAVEEIYGKDVSEFVRKDFYVDDGLASFPSAEMAIDVMRRTQGALTAGGNLRLHKVASNSREVMNSFPKEDLAGDLKNLDIIQQGLPLQRSLGMTWDLNSDNFKFIIPDEVVMKKFTRRGVLSTLNSIFDPLGFISPVVVHGRILMRDMITEQTDWDEPLSPKFKEEWENWCQSLRDLKDLSISRTYLPTSLSSTLQKEIHIFSDASEKAICAVAYIKAVDVNGDSHVGFVMGKSKVSPKHGHTIPRILATTDAEQWNYVSTKDNPADLGTRPTSSHLLESSAWIQGPECISTSKTDTDQAFELQFPENDCEVRPEVCCLKLSVQQHYDLGTERFQRFSDWERLVRAIVFLKRRAQRLSSHTASTDPCTSANEDLQTSVERLIILQVQKEMYGKEIDALLNHNELPNDSTVLSLNPFIDENNILRVGGRLSNSDLGVKERNPVLVPGRHHIATLLIRHYHSKVSHQGRHLTEGAVRNAGYWITGMKRIVASILHKCVKCRKLRRNTEYQQMSDLPRDRLVPGPPFTSVGVDCFGPWQVSTRRTRGGIAKAKRWAVLFTCLSTRAVHIEVIERNVFLNLYQRSKALHSNSWESKDISLRQRYKFCRSC